MNITLKRIALRDTYTIGKLYVDGKYICDTVEDKVRDINKNGKFDGEGRKSMDKLQFLMGHMKLSGPILLASKSICQRY